MAARGRPGRQRSALWLGNYRDSFMSQDAADELAEFLATKIRERVTDPKIAEKLIRRSAAALKKRPASNGISSRLRRSGGTDMGNYAIVTEKIIRS